MKTLKKISRENLKNVKGGISQECAAQQAASTACYTTLAACQADPNSSNPDTVLTPCARVCNKFCFS